MAIVISGRYLGNKKVELCHEPSGSKICTDAPKDNQGEGSTFSPTDLLAASLGSCMVTIMSIVAERDGIDLSGMTLRVEKYMESNPRRVAKLPVELHLPAALESKQRTKLENSAKACPVHHSLAKETEISIEFIYDL